MEKWTTGVLPSGIWVSHFLSFFDFLIFDFSFWHFKLKINAKSEQSTVCEHKHSKKELEMNIDVQKSTLKLGKSQGPGHMLRSPPALASIRFIVSEMILSQNNTSLFTYMTAQSVPYPFRPTTGILEEGYASLILG